MLALDASRSMAWRWKEKLSKLEYLANLFAALAYLMTRQQDPVGLLVHDARELKALPPRSKRSQLEEIFTLLSALQPGAADTFPLLVEELAGMKRHRGQIMLGTDLLEDEGALEKALPSLGARGDEVWLFHVLDRAEVELPFQNVTHLEDSETGEIMPVDVGALRRGHADRLKRFRRKWETLCLENGVIYVPADTAMNYVDVLQSALEKRG
jgi:uncharacterized protein (DUF58 family)